MRYHTSRLLSALAGAWFAAAALVTGGTGAGAEPFEFKQIQLTETHLKGFLGSQPDLVAMADKLQGLGDKPDPSLQKELEALAKKHGFASFAELDDVAANISMVMAGLDPDTGEYTDPIEAIRKEMDDIRKDDTIPEKDKKQMIEEMEEALKATPPLKFKDNIALVKKYQKEIDKAMQDPEPAKKQ